MTLLETKGRDLSLRPEPQRLTIEQAKEALRGLLAIDPDNIRSESDLLAFRSFSDATTTITADILSRYDHITKPQYGLATFKEGHVNEHLLSVTYPVNSAQAFVGNTGTREVRLRYITHTTPSEVKVATTDGVNWMFYFLYRSQPIYDGDSEYSLSARTTGPTGELLESIDLYPGRVLNSSAYQFGARAIQQAAGILLRWPESKTS